MSEKAATLAKESLHLVAESTEDALTALGIAGTGAMLRQLSRTERRGGIDASERNTVLATLHRSWAGHSAAPSLTGIRPDILSELPKWTVDELTHRLNATIPTAEDFERLSFDAVVEDVRAKLMGKGNVAKLQPYAALGLLRRLGAAGFITRAHNRQICDILKPAIIAAAHDVLKPKPGRIHSIEMAFVFSQLVDVGFLTPADVASAKKSLIPTMISGLQEMISVPNKKGAGPLFNAGFALSQLVKNGLLAPQQYAEIQTGIFSSVEASVRRELLNTVVPGRIYKAGAQVQLQTALNEKLIAPEVAQGMVERLVGEYREKKIQHQREPASFRSRSEGQLSDEPA